MSDRSNRTKPYTPAQVALFVAGGLAGAYALARVRGGIRGAFKRGPPASYPRISLGISNTKTAAFRDELVKIAVTMKILRQAAKRLNPIKHLPGPLNMMPGFQVPTKRQMAAAMKIGSEPSHMSAAMERIPEAVKKGMGENMAEYKPGSIVVASPKRIGEAFIIRSPKLRRDIRTTTVIHEGLERSAPSYDPKDLHGNLKVLMDERNLLNTLTGEGSRGVRKLMGGLRAPEFDLQDKRLLETFKDPRVLEFTKPGHKLPKAMKKALLRRQQAPMTDDEARDVVRQQGKFMTRRMFGDVENARVVSGVFDRAAPLAR